MMNPRPFEIMRWEALRNKTPERELLFRMLEREGLSPESREYAPDTRSAEMKFDQPLVMVPAEGHIQVSFPGYGVIELATGDILEISPGILHDIIVEAHNPPAIILQAFRPA